MGSDLYMRMNTLNTTAVVNEIGNTGDHFGPHRTHFLL